MIRFTCPGCKAAHTANEAFADRRAKCVRCGATMYIPRQDGEATFAPYGVLDRGAAGPASGSGGPNSASRGEQGEDGASDPEGGSPDRKRRNVGLLALALLLLVVAGVIAYFFFNQAPPAPTTRRAEAPETKTPAPPEPEPPYEFVGPVWELPPPPVPTVVNAERLFRELRNDPELYRQRFANRFLLVRGVCLSFASTQLRFRLVDLDSSVDVEALTCILAEFRPKFVAPDTQQPIKPPAALALLGGVADPDLTYPAVAPAAGRPVAVFAWTNSTGTITRARLAAVTAPADEKYLAQPLSVTGVVQGYEEDEAGNTLLTFARPTGMRVRVDVVCRFTKSVGAAVQRAAPQGSVATVSGRCAGRTNTAVRLENCQLGGGGTGVDVPTLTADYQVDLLAFPPLSPDTPAVRVTAEDLAARYAADHRKANDGYADRLLEVRGTILKRNPGNRSVQFETATDNSYRVEARFGREEYAAIPPDDDRIAVRSQFGGTPVGGRVITLDDAQYRDPDADDPNVRRLTADYLPLQPGRQWEVVRVLYPEPAKPDAKPPADPKKPAKPAAAQAVRLHCQVLPDKSVVVSLLQTGTFAADSLLHPDAPEVKWAGKPAKPGSPLARPIERAWYRTTDRLIETGQPAKPNDPKSQDVEWKPLLRLNAKAGKSWEVEAGPGQLMRVSVDAFFTDDRGREAVRVVSEMTDARQPDARTQTTVVYARGVGEVWRVVKEIRKDGERVRLEQHLVGTPQVPRDAWGVAGVAGGLSVVPEPAQLKGQPKGTPPR